MSSLRTPARLAAVLAGTVLAALAWAPASADHPAPGAAPGAAPGGAAPGDVAGVTPGTNSVGLPGNGNLKDLPAGNLIGNLPGTVSSVVMAKDGELTKQPTALLQAQTPDEKLAAYRVQAPHRTSRNGASARRVPTRQITKNATEKITWALQRSYPHVGRLTELTRAAGLPAGTALSKEQAVAGTQAAVWHYAEGLDLLPLRNDPMVAKLYGYLTGAANTGTASTGTTPVLTRKDGGPLPTDLGGVAGSLLGPLVVNPAVPETAVETDKSSGMQVVDAEGKPVTTAKGGEQLYLEMPKDKALGTGTLTAVTGPQPVTGRFARGTVTRKSGLLPGAGALPGTDSLPAAGLLPGPNGLPGAGNALPGSDAVDILLVLTGTKKLPIKQTQKARWGRSGLGKDVAVSPHCTAEGMAVDVDNTHGSSPVTLTIAGQPITVPAGTSKVVPVPGELAASYDIPVSDGVSTLRLVGADAGTCTGAGTTGPVVTTEPDCADSTLDVLLSNPTGKTDLPMNVNDNAVLVPRGATKVVKVPVAKDGSYLAEVTGKDGMARRFTGKLDCAVPAKAKVAPADKGEGGGLPVTGAAAGGLVAAGLALVGVGGALFLAARRRRNAAS